MTTKVICFGAIAALALALGACGKSDSPKASSTGASSGQASEASNKSGAGSSDAAWDKKVQAYIKINNAVQKFKSTANPTFAQWAARDREKVAKGDFKAISTSNHYFDGSFLRDMKAAIELPGSLPALDASGKKLLAAAETLLPDWLELINYNKSKKYEDDKGAKGTALLPKYREGMAKLDTALDEFSAQVDIVAKQSHEKLLAKYKASGKLLEMHTLEALGAAEKIVEGFSDAKDLKDANKIAAANAQLEKLEANVEGMKTEHAKRKASSEKTLPMIDRYDSVASNLVSLAGNYREARKKPDAFRYVTSNYNAAVDAYNMMQR